MPYPGILFLIVLSFFFWRLVRLRIKTLQFLCLCVKIDTYFKKNLHTFLYEPKTAMQEKAGNSSPYPVEPNALIFWVVVCIIAWVLSKLWPYLKRLLFIMFIGFLLQFGLSSGYIPGADVPSLETEVLPPIFEVARDFLFVKRPVHAYAPFPEQAPPNADHTVRGQPYPPDVRDTVPREDPLAPVLSFLESWLENKRQRQ